jgi:hypothetical protein
MILEACDSENDAGVVAQRDSDNNLRMRIRARSVRENGRSGEEDGGDERKVTD